MATRDALIDRFPPGTTLGASGALEIGGCDTIALADRFGTPAFVVDEGALRAQAARFRDGLERRRPGSRVVFASKAYPSVAVLRVFAQEGLGCDVVGRGELEIAMAAGMDPALVMMHGNAKSDDDLAAALRHGIGTVVVDGFDDLDRLERLATGPQGVLIRVIPGVEAATHEKILTGHDDSKFGLSLADAAIAIERARRSPRLRLDGLHVHVGSQILDLEPFAQAVEAVSALGTFAVYDVGGGLGVAYAPGDDAPTVEAYLDATVAEADRSLPPDATLIIEPGRSLVAEAGVTLYRVVTVKRSGGARTFVAVDGGMGDNLEAMFYDVGFAATIADRVGGAGEGEEVDLVGRHCESGDVLITGVALRGPRVGDVVAVPVTGAYCFTMANNYNGALRPPVVFVRDGTATEVVRRETYEDLMARELTADRPADRREQARPAPAGPSPIA